MGRIWKGCTCGILMGCILHSAYAMATVRGTDAIPPDAAAKLVGGTASVSGNNTYTLVGGGDAIKYENNQITGDPYVIVMQIKKWNQNDQRPEKA